MRATAVIGANFGDEGKGLMTDFLCAPHGSDALVVRFNGGAQAGHTVQTPFGARHVFHHFGSGTLTGAATFLSRFFIVNPSLWKKERDEFSSPPRVYVDPDAPLTTPYDMLINQELEYLRGTQRHGSCGVGINETITRNQSDKFRTVVSDICDLVSLRLKLKDIIRFWVPRRINLQQVSREFLDRLWSDVVLESFLNVSRILLGESELRQAGFFARAKFKAVIFEGAQGLLLDEDHRFFPHVTRGKPGMPNVRKLADEMQVDDLNTIYVTRAYMTRHGAGPFPSEDRNLYYEDATNAPNEFQGSLRFGSLDIKLLNESMLADMGSNDAVLAVTCLDQIPDGNLVLENLSKKTCVPVRYASWGPTRKDVARSRLDCVPLGTEVA